MKKNLVLGAFFLLLSLGTAHVSFAATSPSYQLQSSTQSTQTFSSSNYTLCGQFNFVAPEGSSASYELSPSLNCSNVVLEAEIDIGGGLGGGSGVGARVCGNGKREFLEQCDDGNILSGDGCSSSCKLEAPICGNAVLQIGEECDDGNIINDDGCSSQCENEVSLPEESFFAAPPELPEESFFLAPQVLPEKHFFLAPPEMPTVSPIQESLPAEVFLPPVAPKKSLVPSVELPEEVEAIREEYLTNDITALFFEQIEGGSGDYNITLHDQSDLLEIKVIPSSEGYFSFQVKNELPDGYYEIQVLDNIHPLLSRNMALEVRQSEEIEAPLLLELDGLDLTNEVLLGDVLVSSDQPVLKAKTSLPATIAIFSELLERSFIVYTDDDSSFTFEYPTKLVSGTQETLRLTAHYENGHISREQVIRFTFDDTHGGLGDVSTDLHQSAPSFNPIFWVFFGTLFFLGSTILLFGWKFSVAKIASVNMYFTSSWPFLNYLMRFILAAILISSLVYYFIINALASTTTPNIIPYQGILKDASGNAITTTQSIRVSFWLDSDFTAGVDRSTTGEIPVTAPGYTGYNEVHSVTPDSNGFFSINIGSVSLSIPDFDITSDLYLQVEVKPNALANPAYETLDVDGIDNTNDRQALGTMPYARNADFIDNAELGVAGGNIVKLETGDVFPLSTIPGGSNADDFIIDADDDALGNIRISFGPILNSRILEYDPVGVGVGDGWFNFTDDVNITGDLTVTGFINGVTIGTKSKTIQLQPRYPNTVLEKGTSGSHLGRMDLFFLDVDGVDAPDNFNYYKWTTRQAGLQDLDLVVRWRIPDDFTAFQAIPITLRYKTDTAFTADNVIDVIIEDTTGTSISTLTGNSGLASTTFTTASIGFGGTGIFTAGSEMTVHIKLSAKNGGAAYLGDLNFHYTGYP